MAPRSGPRRGGAAAKHCGLKPCTQTRKIPGTGRNKAGGAGRPAGAGAREGGQEWVWESLCASSLFWS